MNVQKILSELRAERDQIVEVSMALEKLLKTRGLRRRGRRPKWLTELRLVEKENHGGAA